ncbi:MAG: hypothetical protein ACT6FF_00700 [Methanosarcinaceae archaeon]
MGTRNKAMLFGILITIGMSMVAVAYVTGILEQLPIESNIVATIDGNNKTMSLIRNEKMVQTIKLPENVEGIEYYYDEKSGEILIKYITNEQLNVQRNTHIATLDKAVLIAESDEMVQQLIAGKNYTIPASGIMPGQKDAVVKLVIVIGNKSYEIVVNLGTEKVVAIQEMEELNNSLSISSIDNGDGTII